MSPMIKTVFGAFRLCNLQVVMIHVFSELVRTRFGHFKAISTEEKSWAQKIKRRCLKSQGASQLVLDGTVCP